LWHSIFKYDFARQKNAREKLIAIGENAKIGACTLVVKDVPPNKTVVAELGCQL
jgi:acyl-[acyl carrier protein]--UDP-N-acetylglucosamine O-acyltransferase